MEEGVPSRYKEQTFTFEVTSSGQFFSKEKELHAEFENISKIALSSNRTELLYFRGLVTYFSVGGREVFENFDASMMMANVQHAPDDKYKTLPNIMITDSSKIKFSYQDENHPSVSFQPYTVRLYVYGKAKVE